MFQLPDDVVAKGYVEIRPFHHKQVFYSRSVGFTGTEEQFVRAGFGYQYAQVDKFTRQILPQAGGTR
jgi:hypothetical protein